MSDFLIIRNRFDVATEYTNWVGDGLKAFLEVKGHTVTDLSDEDASPDKVAAWLKYDNKKTMKGIVALDHGSENAFYGEKNNTIAAVIDQANAGDLTKRLHVYTLACSTNADNGVGETAVNDGCFSWLGYIEPVYAMKTQSFKDCIWSYVEAMADGKTMGECEQALRNAYAARTGESFVYQYNLDRLLLRKRERDMTIHSHNRYEAVGQMLRFVSGSTQPGSTNWQVYRPDSIYLDVDTSAAGFTTTPKYFTSLGGKTRHWLANGATSIYTPTPTGFRVYLYCAGIGLDPTLANNMNWHINWFAVGE